MHRQILYRVLKLVQEEAQLRTELAAYGCHTELLVLALAVSGWHTVAVLLLSEELLGVYVPEQEKITKKNYRKHTRSAP